MESFKIENLVFNYPNSDKKVLNKLNLTIEKGEFIVLCGPSGCGKTTLLKHFKTVLCPHGDRTGKILYEGTDISYIDLKIQSSEIGFVMQSPDNQIVTDKVWHELAFGLESLGLDKQTIRLRVAEMASFLGIQNWFYKNVTELSGGQKQLLNLGAILAMHPSVLILDEPTSQLDPIAAVEFLSNIRRINRELGITIIITEHRLEEVFPYSDRVIVMDEGEIIYDDTAKNIGYKLKNNSHRMFHSMPVPMKIYMAVDNNYACPITVVEGRTWIDDYNKKNDIKKPDKYKEKIIKKNKIIAIETDEICFRYKRESLDVVKCLSMKVYKGEFYSILGGNGTGKTTALSLISGINIPYRGTIKLNGKNINNNLSAKEKLIVLPQNPISLFIKKTVKEDLLDVLSIKKISKKDKLEKISIILDLCRLNDLLLMHPYDLSGGEQQRLALAKVLLLEPEILLLDEPTKGLDGEFKLIFSEIIKALLDEGVTVLMVSHDIEFCAKYSDRCAMFFDGNIVSVKEAKMFFSENSFYTTSANRMVRHLLPNAVTDEDVILACGGKIDQKKILNDHNLYGKLINIEKKEKETVFIKEDKIRWKFSFKIFFLIGAIILTLGYIVSNFSDFTFILNKDELLSIGNSNPYFIWRYLISVIFFAMEIILLLNNFTTKKDKTYQVPLNKRKLSKRTTLAIIIIIFLIPLTIYIGVYYLGDRKYYFISMLIILETFLPFIMIFEKKKPQARELIILSVLCALAVSGRVAFFMVPQFKPVAAIIIITAVAFGGEAGFLVGAITAFVSNIFFGQGPWTPWQMFAFGIIGFIAGILFRKGILRRNKIALSIYGGLATFFIYGGIMNPASIIMFQNKPTKEMFYLSYIRGIPFDIIHAVSTVIFLWIISVPMLEKLDRIKTKYGLLENDDF